ncbi:hypothetical protein POTOM_048833 [Populus tomentosa]|uniref:Exocyst component Exo84 C-terminal domain-containing protein n=1 Tax=Populus tomentosa TaxID=118781 RepID=A0A8X8CC29_POPTO|nr:hypothetical protein POTOM_048833 [Populus tomentosa]
MESSSTATRFRFRESENSNDSDSSSASIYSDNGDHDSNLHSMAGKGIKRLCAELLEIQALSDDDFHRNIFSNYSAFLGVFEEVKDMEKELMKLKTQVSTQKGLVKELIDGVYLKLLSEETMESIIEESEMDEPPPSNQLEVHIDDILEILDTLLSENRIDEAIAILETEEENFKRAEVELGDVPSDVLMLYKSLISERKAMLTLESTLVAENSRISAPELQKALNSKVFLYGVCISEVSRFVFSMISRAASSFMKLYGETSPFSSEFIQWVYEEIEVFAVSFARYVISVSEVSKRLSTAVESVQFALSYCFLLEFQRLVLRPCLIEHVRPCMEDVLLIHVDHFKKFIGIFTATDAWVLGRYLLSGILNESCSSMVIGERPEYCLLTSSGRKFVTVLQAITGDVTPLIALQLEDSILRGLMNLFSEYIAILGRAITSETNDSGIILAETVPQQVSILANLSTLENLFSSTILSVFGSNNPIDSRLMKNQSVGFHQQELESRVLFVQGASARPKAHFFQQFVCRMMSPEIGCKLTPQKCMDSEVDPGLVHDLVPSVAFQTTEIRGNIEENLNLERPDIRNQFVLDMHFLAEIIRFGDYFSTNPLVPATLMKSVFDSAGLDSTSFPEYKIKQLVCRDADDGWIMKAAIERLVKIEETESPSDDELVGIPVVEEPPENHSEHASETVNDDGTHFSEDSSLMLEENAATTGASEVSIGKGNANLNAELNHAGQSPYLLKDKGCPLNNGTACLTDVLGNMEDVESGNAAYDRFHFDQENFSPHLLFSETVNEE